MVVGLWTSGVSDQGPSCRLDSTSLGFDTLSGVSAGSEKEEDGFLVAGLGFRRHNKQEERNTVGAGKQHSASTHEQALTNGTRGKRRHIALFGRRGTVVQGRSRKGPS